MFTLPSMENALVEYTHIIFPTKYFRHRLIICFDTHCIVLILPAEESFRFFTIHFAYVGNDQLTINFNLAQITVRKLRVIARINNLRSALVVVNDVTCMKWTLNSLVLWWRTYSILYFMETKMAVVLWSCIRNIQRKSCQSRCECRWCYWKKCTNIRAALLWSFWYFCDW